MNIIVAVLRMAGYSAREYREAISRWDGVLAAGGHGGMVTE